MNLVTTPCGVSLPSMTPGPHYSINVRSFDLMGSQSDATSYVCALEFAMLFAPAGNVLKLPDELI
uniref:Uncharacterized protein n=1 Tax=Setaria italica TaxID=4555 RepID=K4AHR8_SETIT